MKVPFNNKSLLTIALSFMACIGMNAQDAYSNEKSAITKIKRAPEQYVYSEATCKTQEEAMAVAEELFYQNVNEYVAEQKKLRNSPDIVVNDTKAIMSEITMPRGTNMHRCFLYVKKKDIIGTKNTVLLTTPTEAETTEDENDSQELAATLTPVFPQAAIDLAGIKSIAQLNSAIKQMKTEGSITEYEKYKNIENINEWYLVLYDASGNINALLSDGDVRYNVATGEKDELKNYPKNAALGIKFKK